MKRDTLRKLVPFALLLAALAGVLALPRREPTPPPRPLLPDPQLERALVEARANVEAARALGAGPRVLIETAELELALRTCPPLLEDGEEHVRLLLVSRLIRDLARAFARGEGARRLADERLTEEDFRFLLAAIEARLARALGREAPLRAEAFDRSALRQFRGLDFEQGIRSLFE